MIVKERRILRTYPFDKYLRLPGWSHSLIRNNGKDFTKPTNKMTLGSYVHQYLMEPENYPHDNRRMVRAIALKLQEFLGDLLHYLEPELAVTCIFEYEDFYLRYKGRIDLGIVGRIVIDIKVSKQPLKKGIEFFHYDTQLVGYARSIDAKVALIIRIDPDTLVIETYLVPLDSHGDYWWHEQIKQKGDVIV